MPDYVPLFTPGKDVTHTAAADVIGGRLVEAAASTTATSRRARHAAAGSLITLGVAGRDAKAGEIFPTTRGGVQRLIAAGAIAAGDRVAAAADGKVATATAATLGTALTAAADGATAQIQLDR